MKLEKEIERLEKEYDSLMAQIGELYLSGFQGEADKLYKEKASPLAKKISSLQEKQIREILG